MVTPVTFVLGVVVGAYLYRAWNAPEADAKGWRPVPGSACDSTGARIGDLTAQKPHDDWTALAERNKGRGAWMQQAVNQKEDGVLPMKRRKKA